MTTRRQFVGAALGAVAATTALPVLSSCSGGGGGGGTTDLQMSWWGGDTTNQHIQSVISLYEKANTTVSISPWFTSYSNYWPKIDTLAAGKTMPDILLMGQYLSAYVQKGLLNDLTPYQDRIDLSDMPDLLVQQVTKNGKLMGVPLASNMPAVIYNETALKTAGVDAPDPDVTWDDFAKYLAELAPKLPSGTYPCDDNSSTLLPTFDVWVRQFGDGLWTADGKVAFTVEMVHQWFAYWDELRKNKLVPPGEMVIEAAQTGAANASPFVTGKTFFTFNWDNFITTAQLLMKDSTLSLMRYPQGSGSQNAVGDWLKCSAEWCQAVNTKHGEQSADFMKFYTHNTEAITAMTTDFGLPASGAAVAQITDSAPDYVKTLIAYEKATIPKARSREIADPSQINDVTTALTRAGQSVMLGKASAAAAAQQFFDDSQKALA